MNKKQAIMALAVIAGAGALTIYKQEPAPIQPDITIDGHQFAVQRQGNDALHEYAVTLRPGGQLKNPETLMRTNAGRFCNHALTPVLEPGWPTTWNKDLNNGKAFQTRYRCKNFRQLEDGRTETWNQGPFTLDPDAKR